MEQVTTEQANRIIREEIVHCIPDVTSEKHQLDMFIKNLQPEVERTLASGSVDEVGWLRDRFTGRCNRPSLGRIYRSRDKLIPVLEATFRMLVRMQNATLP